MPKTPVQDTRRVYTTSKLIHRLGCSLLTPRPLSIIALPGRPPLTLAAYLWNATRPPHALKTVSDGIHEVYVADHLKTISRRRGAFSTVSNDLHALSCCVLLAVPRVCAVQQGMQALTSQIALLGQTLGRKLDDSTQTQAGPCSTFAHGRPVALPDGAPSFFAMIRCSHRQSLAGHSPFQPPSPSCPPVPHMDFHRCCTTPVVISAAAASQHHAEQAFQDVAPHLSLHTPPTDFVPGRRTFPPRPPFRLTSLPLAAA